MMSQETVNQLEAVAKTAQSDFEAAKAQLEAEIPKVSALAKIRAFSSNVSTEVQNEFHAAVAELESLL